MDKVVFLTLVAESVLFCSRKAALKSDSASRLRFLFQVWTFRSTSESGAVAYARATSAAEELQNIQVAVGIDMQCAHYKEGKLYLISGEAN